MGFAKRARGNKHIVAKKRYDLSQIVSEMSKCKLPPETQIHRVHTICRQLRGWDPKIHLGASVGIAYALSNFKELETKINLEKKVRTIFIYGGVARGLKNDRRPKDIDIMVISKADAKIPSIKTHPRVNIMTYSDNFFNEEHLKEDNPQSAFDRMILVLPVLPLYGEEYLKSMIKVAMKNVKVSDVNQFVESQVKKARDDMWSKGEWIPPHEEIKEKVIRSLGIMKVMRGLLLSEQLDLSKNLFEEKKE